MNTPGSQKDKINTTVAEQYADDTAVTSRRDFLSGVGKTVGFAAIAGFAEIAPLQADHAPAETPNSHSRTENAYQVRLASAERQRKLKKHKHPTNGDESRYSNRIANYTKGLPHNDLGEVDPVAYDALLKALASGEAADFEAVPLGGYFPLGNPLSVYSFQLEGADPHYFATPPAPTFDSEEVAGEIIELYWLALCRDIAFTDYGAEPLTLGAIDDLKQFSAYADVDTSRLFRNLLANDLTGPYLSQFFWLDVPYGLATLQQKFPVPVAGQNYMTDFAGWLKSQNGLVGGPPAATQSRYIMTGRDLAEWVHKDFTYQGFLNAALILDSYGPDLMDENNPYRNFKKQGAYITFGLGDLATLLPAVSLSALKAAFYQQWLVHRRCRPEEYAGWVHKYLSKSYPVF